MAKIMCSFLDKISLPRFCQTHKQYRNVNKQKKIMLMHLSNAFCFQLWTLEKPVCAVLHVIHVLQGDKVAWKNWWSYLSSSSIESALYAWNLWEPNVNGEACQSNNNERKVSMAYLTRWTFIFLIYLKVYIL